jgi:hypothetical protein
MAMSRQEARNRPTPEKIKVRVSFTLEVDVHGWARDYGVHREDVREHVKKYVDSLVREHGQEIDNWTVVKSE